MAAILSDGELILAGDVGADFFGDFFTYSDVVIALAQVDDEADLTVRLNSGGGIATEGAAIHALLSRRAGQTNVIVEGIAASAASLIGMAGNHVTMAAGSSMMIHDPSGITLGTSADHAKTIEYLEALAAGYARIYAAKSGKKPAQCRDMMKAETWFTAEQAVAAGFADSAADSQAKVVAAFDYRLYAHAPEALKSLAKTNSWSRAGAAAPVVATATPTRQTEEIDMTDKERADALAAEIAELKANQPDVAKAVADAVKADRERRATILTFDEAKGREALAETLIASSMTPDEIKAALSAAPKAADANSYEKQRLAGAGLAQPRSKSEPGASAEAVTRIVGNYRSLTGAAAPKQS